MSKDTARQAVEEKVRDARGGDKEPAGDGFGFLGSWEPAPLDSPLDEETLDESATQFYTSRRISD